VPTDWELGGPQRQSGCIKKGKNPLQTSLCTRNVSIITDYTTCQVTADEVLIHISNVSNCTALSHCDLICDCVIQTVVVPSGIGIPDLVTRSSHFIEYANPAFVMYIVFNSPLHSAL
jgi:hypothetical protein